MVRAEIWVPVSIWLRETFPFLFATRDTYHSSCSVVILLQSPACFHQVFPPSEGFFLLWDGTFWHFHFCGHSGNILTCFQPSNCSSMIVSIQMMSCRHFKLNYCYTTLNFKDISLAAWILVKHVTAWNSEWIKSFCALSFTQIISPARSRFLHLTLLLFVGFRDRYTLHKSVVP